MGSSSDNLIKILFRFIIQIKSYTSNISARTRINERSCCIQLQSSAKSILSCYNYHSTYILLNTPCM